MTDKKLILVPGARPEFIGEWTLRDIMQIISMLQASVDKILSETVVSPKQEA